MHCIGALDAEGEAETARLVKKAFGPTKDWRAEVIQQLGLTEAVCEQIAGLWSQTLKLAADKGTNVSAQEFSATMVEENFTDLIEMLDGS